MKGTYFDILLGGPSFFTCRHVCSVLLVEILVSVVEAM